MRYNKRYLCLPAAALLALLFSCRRESLHEEASGPLRFAVTEAAPDWSTKASTPLDGAPISVWAYNMPATASPVGDWLVDGGSPSAVTASYDGSYWKPASSIPFNSSGRAASWYTRWFAVAPQPAAGNGITLGSIAHGTAPTLSFTVPAAAASQPDLVVAATDSRAIDEDSAVPLNFSHVLTGVRLVADATANLTAATLSGVYKSGTLNLLSKEWTLNTGVIGSFDFDFTSPSPTLMMLPQWLPAGAKLSYTIDGIDVEADLSGHEWKMGKLVIYRIEGSEFHIEVMENDFTLTTFDYLQSVAEVNCYSVSPSGGNPVAAGWKVAGVYDTRSEAIEGGTSTSGRWTAEKSGNYLRVKINEIPAVSARSVTSILQAAAERGTADSPWNLANPHGGADKILESANTYIINAPGYYRIPLVIGNGVKNNTPNPAAYPSNFVDYKGQSIQNPYLHKSSAQFGTPTSGAVVWTETPGMVENLSVMQDEENDLYWLTFNVQASKIEQGCTVVSVKDAGGTVMWSWLLWCTEYEPAFHPYLEAGRDDVPCEFNANGDILYLMPRNLGWSVAGNVKCSAGADAWVRVEAEYAPDAYALVYVRTPAMAETEIDAEDASRDGHAPYFQWGRKDAMPPSTVSSLWQTRSQGSKTPDELIKYPGHHVTATYYPFTGDGGNFVDPNWWSASATAAGQDVATVKTVYDPCPAGYTVPRHDAFHGFNQMENIVWSYNPKWMRFPNGYLTPHNRSVILPAGGHRNATPNDGTPIETSYGRYWVAVPQGGNTARRLTFGPLDQGASPSVTVPQNVSGGMFNKAGEHYIRPAREE